jgi:hypothetical protein
VRYDALFSKLSYHLPLFLGRNAITIPNKKTTTRIEGNKNLTTIFEDSSVSDI